MLACLLMIGGQSLEQRHLDGEGSHLRYHDHVRDEGHELVRSGRWCPEHLGRLGDQTTRVHEAGERARGSGCLWQLLQSPHGLRVLLACWGQGRRSQRRQRQRRLLRRRWWQRLATEGLR